MSSDTAAGGTRAPLTIFALLVAAWLSAGFEPWRAAASGALAPSDFATDFVPAARVWTPGGFPPMDAATGNAEAARLGAAPYMNVGVPFGAHPPPAVLLVAALAPLGFTTAALAWLLLSLAGLAVVAWVAVDAVFVGHPERRAVNRVGGTFRGPSQGPLPSQVAAVFAVLTVWPPVLHNIEKGQWSLLLAGLLAGAWWAFTRRRDHAAGALIGLAAAFKVMPLLILMAFIGAPAPRRRRVFVGAGATLLGAIVVSGTVLGGHAWIDFLRAAPANTQGWQTGPANTLSLWGALARFLVGGPFARPISPAAIGAPVAMVLWVFAAGVLVVLGTRLSLRAWPASANTVDPAGTEAAGPAPAVVQSFAVWSMLAVVLSPLSWTHSAAMLLLPLTLTSGLVGGPSLRPIPLILGAATAVLTIPRATLFLWAGALPVSPARGLILALHLAAALSMIGWAIRAGFATHPADFPIRRADRS